MIDSALVGALIERMTGVIMDGFANTAHKGDFDQAKRNVRVFLNENINRLVTWTNQNPGRRPPVYYNSDTGEVVWLSRSQTRRLSRMRAKEQRQAVLASYKTLGPIQKINKSANEPTTPLKPLEEVADDRD